MDVNHISVLFSKCAVLLYVTIKLMDLVIEMKDDGKSRSTRRVRWCPLPYSAESNLRVEV